MRPSIGLLGLVLLVAPTILAQDNTKATTTAAQTTGDNKATGTTATTAPAETTAADSKTENSNSSSSESSGTASANPVFSLTGLTTLAGLGIPTAQVPNTAGAAFMQKSDLPDGTVFICVGAFLAFLGAAVLAWRGLVAWALHRSVKRAAMAQNLADLKAMSAVPGKKRGMYNVVGASSNMSLDHLAAAPTGTSRPPKPFAANPGGTPPKAPSNLFFSPTAGGSTGLRDSMVNRSSTYLPAGYYAAGNAQPASGSPVTHVGGGGHGAHLSTYSLQTPGNRFSHRSGVSPPGSPSLPPSRGYDRAPPSRDGLSLYNRNSVATLGTPGSRGNPYGQQSNPSQLSLNVPGGTDASGGRAPSAYLEDLFESHGNGPRERY
ncbi:hypothetical protein K458DRAFT_305483 [Lentithecium fluviatile CBS 122367]|uniref:CSI2 protein n=1 Tax=Lentithecium fluviatile CBS 122367 TaxID=1168545 RepID=A0A6G1IZ18_9PLEO|nr:hypothetical protein K458DRAFT_305483 [Lentithecium fluviatile CBS 122367]